MIAKESSLKTWRRSSADRFETYVVLAQGDKKEALNLYKRNILLSHRFYIILHILEICLRNKIDICFTKRYGDKWYNKKDLILNNAQKEMIPQVHTGGRGNLIAALPFGFWTSFFGRSYESLWRQDLRFIFNEAKPLIRSYLANELNNIRYLRNRIAHHECILKMDIVTLEKSAFEIIDLLSPHALRWLKADLLED